MPIWNLDETRYFSKLNGTHRLQGGVSEALRWLQAETGRDVAWLAEREVRSTKLYVVASCSSGVPTPIPFSEWEIKGTKKLKQDFSQKRGLLHLGHPNPFSRWWVEGGAWTTTKMITAFKYQKCKNSGANLRNERLFLWKAFLHLLGSMLRKGLS